MAASRHKRLYATKWNSDLRHCPHKDSKSDIAPRPRCANTGRRQQRHVALGVAWVLGQFSQGPFGVLAITYQPVQKIADDLAEHHADTHDHQCTQGAEFAGKPTNARLSWRKHPVANHEAANSANQPTNDLKDWKGTYHRTDILASRLVTWTAADVSVGSKPEILTASR
jgi:hypothetical protein